MRFTVDDGGISFRTGGREALLLPSRPSLIAAQRCIGWLAVRRPDALEDPILDPSPAGHRTLQDEMRQNTLKIVVLQTLWSRDVL